MLFPAKMSPLPITVLMVKHRFDIKFKLANRGKIHEGKHFFFKLIRIVLVHRSIINKQKKYLNAHLRQWHVWCDIARQPFSV